VKEVANDAKGKLQTSRMWIGGCGRWKFLEFELKIQQSIFICMVIIYSIFYVG
jgi:hypothetical protein